MGFLSKLLGGEKQARPAGSTGLSAHFAVVDVETTGLNPVEDRIIELAVVIVTAAGEVVHEWTTLVNPGDGDSGSTGAVAVHGVQSEWLAAAPSFGEIVGDLHQRLVGRIVTSHNSRFDMDFLEGEYKRLGLKVGMVTTVCTMDMAQRLGLERRLVALAAQLGIPLYAHSALDDARATAQALTAMLRYVDPSTFAGDPTLKPGTLPDAPPSGKAMHREAAAELTRPTSFMAEAAGHLPSGPVDGVNDSEAAAAYLTLLEDVMVDGYMSPDEKRQLLEVARRWDLTVDELETLHREFLDGLLDAALEDRRLTKDEREQVQRAAEWLGVEAGDLDLLVRGARARSRASVDEERATIHGRSVAFTGRGVYSKSIREAFCAKYGIVFRSSVTNDCELLVVGDATVENATVIKARDRGVPIAIEAVFWERLGEKIPRT